jgi:hypothetical protein
MRSVCLVLMGVLSASSLPAQATVIQPEAPLDSARAALRDAVLVLRDQTSGASLLSRARVMHDACARSARAVPPTREAILAAQLSEPQRVKRRRTLVNALDRLRGALSRCEVDFAAMSQPGEGETVRGYAYARSQVVQGALRKYEESLREFMAAMGIYISPAGSTPRASSG